MRTFETGKNVSLGAITTRESELSAEPFAAALAALNEDHSLGRYELLAPIGRGGMAVVWAARLRGTRGFSKVVALKTMLPALSSDPRFEKMFLTEAEIASRIKHPNVGEILDLGEDRGVLYFVMDLVDGESVSSLVRACESANETLPYGVAARIVAQAARGLHAAHELGVVHRDVSPQNILVGVDGHVKIVDFGVAKAAQRSDTVTSSGFIKGKVAYLAPEQVAGPDIDGRADVFALGAVLYELTALVHPFRGATDLATLLEISSDDPAPRPTREGYPDALWKIAERALSKDPAARYRSMRELALDLEALYDEEPDDLVASFAKRILEPRRAEREAELRDATIAADQRSERRAKTLATPVDPLVPVATSTKPPKSTRSRTLFVASAVGLLGIAIGAVGVRASDNMRTPTTTVTTVTSSTPTLTPSPTPSPTLSLTPSLTLSPSPSFPASASASSDARKPAPRPASLATPANPKPALHPTPAETASAAPPPIPPAPSSSTPLFRRPGF